MHFNSLRDVPTEPGVRLLDHQVGERLMSMVSEVVDRLLLDPDAEPYPFWPVLIGHVDCLGKTREVSMVLELYHRSVRLLDTGLENSPREPLLKIAETLLELAEKRQAWAIGPDAYGSLDRTVFPPTHAFYHLTPYATG